MDIGLGGTRLTRGGWLAVLTLALVLSTMVPALVPGAGATSTSPLVADAGESRATLDGAVLPVEGIAYGGQAPYDHTWSIQGASDLFEDPFAAETTVDLTGAEGTIELTLTVRDSQGETASDTVLYHVSETVGQLLDADGTVDGGVPDEEAGASGLVDGQTQTHTIPVPAGVEVLEVVLDWSDGSADLDLQLVDPQGDERGGNQGASADKPELVILHDPAPGDWTAEVRPWSSGQTDYTLVANNLTSVDLPTGRIIPPFRFGHQEPVDLFSRASPSDATVGWDVDQDGVAEATGEHGTVELPPGEHDVILQVTGPDGFEARAQATYEVLEDVPEVLSSHCVELDRFDLSSMEWSLGGRPCWIHGGHHTFVLEEPVRILGGEGFVRSVEQPFSPPTEYEQQPLQTTPIHVQVSPDGQSWTELDAIEYAFLSDPIGFALFPFTGARQDITFELEADEETPARFIRVHQPRSLAQGLSGFLDQSRIDFFVEPVDDPEPITSGDTTVDTLALSCQEGDLLEDFFADHPCWFGGINRYDAPSFYHTYQPGQGATVTSIEASVEILPWRTDDYWTPVPVTDAEGVTLAREDERQAYRDQVQNATVTLQASPDGRSWETLSSTSVPYGALTSLTVDLDEPEPARFLRLVPGFHPRFDDFRSVPANHHPEGFFVASQLELEGSFPG